MVNGCHTNKRTNKGTQLTCVDTIKEYQPTKFSIPVWIHTSARGKVYRKLGAELKIDNDLPKGPVKSFEQLLVDQPAWISDLVKFITFTSDKHKYDKMSTTIEGVLTAHAKNGYLIAVSDR